MKKLFSILFFSIFLFAQFGKVISYAYCKWEFRSAVSCDCEKIFTKDEHQGSDQLAKVNLVVKGEEPVVLQSDETSFVSIGLIKIHFAYPPIQLLNGFTGLPFHPPAEV